MAIIAQTLKEIALDKAKKRPDMVDNLTENAPILDILRWVPASHGLWNVEEALASIKGASFVDLGAPLPAMDVTSNLEQTYVSIMGGEIEASRDKVEQFGGASKYFAKKERPIFRQAGMDTEHKLFYDFFRKAAIKAGNVLNVGGTADSGGKTGLYTIAVVRLDDANNIGIYDPSQFNQGRLLNITPLNGGSLYHLRSQPGVAGYGVEYRGRFGWQLIGPERTVSVLVNVHPSDDTNKNKIPTISQVEDAIANVRGDASNTYIFGHVRALRRVFNSFKENAIQYVNADSDLKTMVGSINGVKIVGSYNMSDGNEPLYK